MNRFSFCVLLTLAAVTACGAPRTAGPASPRNGADPSVAGSAGPAGASGELPPIPYTYKSVVIQGGGFVTGLVYSPVKPGTLYARTDIGGAYRYDPQTKSWVPLTDFFGRKDASFLGIESIAVDPVKPDRVYLAVGMYSWRERDHRRPPRIRSGLRGSGRARDPLRYPEVRGNRLAYGARSVLGREPDAAQNCVMNSQAAGAFQLIDSPGSLGSQP